MINGQRSAFTGLWAIYGTVSKQLHRKTKNNLYHIYCNAPGLLSTIPGERQRASGCQGKRSGGDPKDAKDEGTKGATRALLSSPISHL